MMELFSVNIPVPEHWPSCYRASPGCRIEKYGLLDRYSPIKRGDSPYVSIELGMVVTFRHGEAPVACKVIHGLQWDVGVQEARHERVS